MLKVLNLYASIGGNRLLWKNAKVTAVEKDVERAKIYQDLFPNDTVIVGDAHEFLIEHYGDYQFIWSSPPCQSHSQIRYNLGFKANRKYEKVKAVYPNMQLYEEIILLRYWFSGNWVIENTIPYYEPLPYGHQIVGGHIIWSNCYIAPFDIKNRNHRGGTVETLQERKGIDLSKYDIKNKRQILRDCVEPELGKHIFDCCLLNQPIESAKTESKQMTLF